MPVDVERTRKVRCPNRHDAGREPLISMKICHFVSDLHLFSNRSRGDRHLDAIHATAAQSDEFVLAGDVFDFHWSNVGDAEASARAAERWLHALLKAAPNCRIHALLGNHDHHPALIKRLEQIRNDTPAFSWHPYHIRIGAGVFLHGDAANFRMNAARLEAFRDRCAAKPQKHPGLDPLYDIAIKSRLHVLCARAAYPHRIVARRLRRYLDEIGHGPGHGVRNVHFGHTHRHMNGYERHGLRFHNCGAPIDGVRFNILKADVS